MLETLSSPGDHRPQPRLALRSLICALGLSIPALANPASWILSIEYGGGALGQIALHHEWPKARVSIGVGGGLDVGKQDIAGDLQDGLLWTAFGQFGWEFLKASPLSVALSVRGGFTSLAVAAGGAQAWYVAPGLTVSIWHAYATISALALLGAPETTWVPQLGLGLKIPFGEEPK